ncbi:MAG TPA: hypothetical protein VN513_06245 [Gemmatimonadales bacterium]|nr:hypothetical protein [Gemmatimonadales bacterium]
MSGLLFPKGRPAALDRQAKKTARVSIDHAESAKAKARAHGQCEVTVIGEGRCLRRDTETHHLINGRLRGRGESAQAERKIRCCHRCHQAITQHLLQRVGEPIPHFQDRYRRVQ